jgi:hypothetical protein
MQASTLILPSPILGMGLIVSLIYYWSRKNPDVEMSLMFGIRFKSIYFPWVLCAMRYVVLHTLYSSSSFLSSVECH